MTTAERPVDKQNATTEFHIFTLYQTTRGIKSEESPSYYKIAKYRREEKESPTKRMRVETPIALRPDLLPDCPEGRKSEVNWENTTIGER